MNKAVELISEWIEEKEKYLVILIERRDSEEKWSKVKEKSDYYLPMYLETKAQVETLEREIAECQQAFIVLDSCIVTTELPQP
jgi:hypothetical protein